MSKQRVKKKRIFTVIGVILVLGLIGAIGGYAMAANDDGDEFELQPPSVHVKDSDVEVSTLAIGSHLIYIGSMTDELYRIASDSASTFSQQDMYYKSELSGGTWYEITAATSIADISTAGSPVSKDVIEKLEFTHHTKSDGHTYDLVSGTAVDIFDIKDPYDLDVMEELRPVVVQYQMIRKKSGKNSIDRIDLELLDEFFAFDMKNIKLDVPEVVKDEFGQDIIIESKPDEDVAMYERGLSNLQAYYDRLDPNSSESDKRDITMTIMGKIDATRRLYVLAKLYEMLTELNEDVMNAQSKVDSENSTFDKSLSEAIIEAQDNVQSSLFENSAKALTKGTTVIGLEEYNLITQVIDTVENNSSECDALISKVADLYNIRDNIVDKRDQELLYLNGTLIPAGETAYKNALAAGTSKAYKDAKAAGAAESALGQLLEDTKSETNAVRVEYQFLINAKVLRMNNEEAQEYLMGLLDEADKLRKQVPGDESEATANESIDQFKQWLKETLAEVVNGSSDGTEMGKLQGEKDELLEKQQEALDNNNMSEYNRLQALIDAKDADIAELEKELTDIITSSDSSDSEKAVAAAGLGSGTAAAAAMEIADQTVSDMQAGDFSGLDNALNSLDALLDSNSGVVTAALKDIKNALDSATSGQDGTDDGLSKAQKKAFDERLEDMIDEGTAKSNQNGLSASEVEQLIEELLGGPFLSLSDDEKMAAALAVEWYGEIQNNRKLKDLSASYADSMMNQGTRGAYKKLTTRVPEYVSTKTLSECIGYRYVFDDARTEVTLQRRQDFYTFSANSVHVGTPGDTAILSAKAEYQTFVYIPADYVQETFEYYAEYVDNSSIALLFNEQQRASAQALYEAFMQRGGM